MYHYDQRQCHVQFSSIFILHLVTPYLPTTDMSSGYVLVICFFICLLFTLIILLFQVPQQSRGSHVPGTNR